MHWWQAQQSWQYHAVVQGTVLALINGIISLWVGPGLGFEDV
jgi:hypothetical protein